VVVGSPYYFAVDGGGHRRHVEAVLEAAGLPGLLYNIPQCTHAVLAADTVAALARDARVLGMKDSAGDFLTFQRYLAVKRERPDFRVLQGQESLLASSVLHGGDGAVPGVANIAPRLCVDLVRAAHAKDSARATQLQEQVTGLTRVYEQGHWLPALKAACAQLGLGNGRPAPPLEPAGDAARAAIAALLAPLS
jgi:4-hydroxy-tetrahydrodipicolinate synthase